MSASRSILFVLVAISLGGCLSSPASRRSSPLTAVLAHDAGYDFYTLGNMVSFADAIILGEYEELTDGGLYVMAPTFPTGPDLSVSQLLTRVEVTEVLKGHGIVTATMPITYGYAGEYPEGSKALGIDAASDFPQVWPPSTEFILFVSQSPQEGVFGVGLGSCGRLLTDGAEVTCSDGDRTVLDFMSGVGRDEFIARIRAEVADPSDTETPGPTMVPESTPNP